MFPSYKHVHMIGIGGTGMCGIADVLLTLGYNISGSDIKKSDVITKLKKHGAKIFIGHKQENVQKTDVVVVSSAINDSNPEIKFAKQNGIPIITRAEMLAELMRIKYSVVIAGTHGKTTTTSLIGFILDKSGIDPTVVIGGRLNHFKSNSKLGKGKFFVAEGDESDRSFLLYSPTIAVITNIEAEHMENYKSLDDLKNAFADFANKVPFYGSAVVCVDDKGVKSILPSLKKKIITYGSSDAEFTFNNLNQIEDKMTFDVLRNGKILDSVKVKLSGKHHALNVLASIAVSMEAGLDFSSIKKALAKFPGVARRFEILFRKGPIVVDDYAHHPTELLATIRAVKDSWPEHRVFAVCQPHRFSRLKYHFDGFVSALSHADPILITEVYPAGEKPQQRFTGEKLWKKMRESFPHKQLMYVKNKNELLQMLKPACRQRDVLLFLGAGDITKLANQMAKILKQN